MSTVEDKYVDLIRSPRVSEQTREVLLARMAADDPNYEPRVLSLQELETLRSVMGRVIPQEAGETEIDLAARLDKKLAETDGDGWRYASLPRDVEAYQIGLRILDEFAMKLSAVSFARLSMGAQDSLLEAIASGRVRSEKLTLKRWFEDVRADATQIYVSHPRTLAKMGYSGIADDPTGFVQIGIGARETWEPEPFERAAQ